MLSALAPGPAAMLTGWLHKLEQMGCPASLQLDAQALKGKWVERDNPLKGARMDFSNPTGSGLERALIIFLPLKCASALMVMPVFITINTGLIYTRTAKVFEGVETFCKKFPHS